jgi:hypothetical protein
MSLFRKKKPKSQGERLGAWRIDAIPSRDFDPEIGDLLAELEVPAERERQGWQVGLEGGPLLLKWLDEDRVLTGLAFLNDTRDARELTDLLRRNLDPRVVYYALGDAEEDSLAARFKLPFDTFDRAAALLAIETTAALIGDEAAAGRARALRGGPAGELEEQGADARTREALAAGLEAAGLSATDEGERLAVPVERGVVQAIPRDNGESVLFMHELEFGEGAEHVPMLRWMLESSDWSGARLGLASLPGGEGAFAACAVSAGELQPQAAAWGVEQVLRLADAYDVSTGRA